jgi:hypothetical protein
MDMLVQMMVVCWYCIVTGAVLKETVSRDYKFFSMRVLGYFNAKMGKPDAAGAGCLGCGGRVELWLQGVQFGYFNPNNAVAVVDGIIRSIFKDLKSHDAIQSISLYLCQNTILSLAPEKKYNT